MPTTKVAIPTVLACVCAVGAFAQARQIANLDTKKILGTDQACALAGSNVHFLSAHYLVFFAGPDLSCYRAINNLELVVMGIDGQVVARKPWSSTFPIVVLGEARIATADTNNVVLLNDHLQAIQTSPLPQRMQGSSVFLSKFGTNTLLVSSPQGQTRAFDGDTLTPTADPPKPSTGAGSPFLVAPDGSTYSYSPQKLFRTLDNGTELAIASLSWVNPCTQWCQEYEAGMSYTLATSSSPRILFSSNGSRFPVTDAAGLFPYFRVQVFDLISGGELYRKEFITKTSVRSATLSPDGKLIALTDGQHIALEEIR